MNTTHTVVAAILALSTIGGSAFASDSEQLTRFRSDGGEFSMLMSSPVYHRQQHAKTALGPIDNWYTDDHFLVQGPFNVGTQENIPKFERQCQSEFINGVRGRNRQIAVLKCTEMSGPGWKGSLITYGDAQPRMSLLYAHCETHPITYIVSAPQSLDEGKRNEILKSLRIDPNASLSRRPSPTVSVRHE